MSAVETHADSMKSLGMRIQHQFRGRDGKVPLASTDDDDEMTFDEVWVGNHTGWRMLGCVSVVAAAEFHAHDHTYRIRYQLKLNGVVLLEKVYQAEENAEQLCLTLSQHPTSDRTATIGELR